jgi:putative Ca2+/H+ antiporter (TMEM165/GDT1 family)
VSFAVAASVFPIIFLGELPDKTMFASLVLASRGRPLAVWVGAALAFVIHAAIAVTVGVVLFHIVPHRVLDGIVAAAFFVGAAYSFDIRNQEEETAEATAVGSPVRTALTALGVIFVAEWGDLTQILTANLAARYHSVFAVAVGAVLALWAVAALAVIGGSSLLKILSVRTLRLVTAVILVALGAYSLAGVI